MSTTYKTLKDALIARNKEWTFTTKPPLSFWGNAMAGEAGEACNVIKKLDRAMYGFKGSTATLEDLADELADVKIYIAQIELETGIDGDAATARKFNKTSDDLGFDTHMKVPA